MILLADQKRALADLVALKLRREGFTAEAVPDALFARQRVAEGRVTLVMLDPAVCGPGLDELKKIRSLPDGAQLPIIVFGSSDSKAKHEQALAAGADLCLVRGKVAPSELVAHVRALLQRETEVPVVQLTEAE